MKQIFFILLTLICINLTAQDQLRIFFGGNLTNVVYHLVDQTTNEDSFGLRRNNILLPLLGVDMDFDINTHFGFTTGLGVSWQGSKHFNQPPPPAINIDTDLKLGYLRIPLLIQYNLLDNLKIFAGYSFQYNFRKNQGFFSINEFNESVSDYKPFHHALLLGSRFDIKKWSISANYQFGLSRIFDTKNSSSQKRAYLDLRGFQISLGYTLEDD